MTNQRGTRTGKNSNRDITSLCGPAFGKVLKSQALADIKHDPYSYYVEEVVPRVYVRVGHRNGVEYLTTYADGYSKNNLDNLPDCWSAKLSR